MASNNFDSEELFAELQCSVCQDRYTDPVNLVCGHAFCRQCVLGVFVTMSERQSYLSCPCCRSHHFTSESEIKKMPVNLKLRNIVSAFHDNVEATPSFCEEHNKSYMLFCLDCDELKCLSCFRSTCSSHDVEDLEDAATRIRSKISAMETKWADKLKVVQLYADKDPVSSGITLAKEGLLCVLGEVGELRHTLLTEKIEGHEEVIKDLQMLAKSSDSSLVKNREDWTDILVPDACAETSMDVVDNACKKVLEDLKCVIQRFQQILNCCTQQATESAVADDSAAGLAHTNNDTNADSGPARGSVIDGVDGVEGGTASGVAVGGFDHGSHVANAAESVAGAQSSAALQCGSFCTHSSLVNQAMPRAFGDDADDLNTALFNRISITSFIFNETHVLYSVTSYGSEFVANTSDGCTRLSITRPRRIVSRAHVKAVCTAHPTHVLLLINNCIEVHVPEILDWDDGTSFVYALPPHVNSAHWGTDLECIGVTGPAPIYCVISDTRHRFIYLWDLVSYGWQDNISVVPHSSFKMCVYLTTIYLAFYDIGRVQAVGLRGETRWMNSSSCINPTGIVADESGIYVCESAPDNSCIVVLNHNGTLRRNILMGYIERPWSVAVNNGVIAVVEHHVVFQPHTPTKVTLFDLSLVV